MSVPLSDTRLTEIRERAAGLYESSLPENLPAEAVALAGEDVPDLLAELDRLRDIVTRAQNAADADDMEAVRIALGAKCPRCNGSGIDPEHSSSGCTDPDRGAEPPNLEPCIACQYPLPEAELVDDTLGAGQ